MPRRLTNAKMMPVKKLSRKQETESFGGADAPVLTTEWSQFGRLTSHVLGADEWKYICRFT